MSRKLDAAVAKARGCVVARADVGLGELICTCENRAHEQANTTSPRILARYSENIAAAYQVVGWMNRDRKWIVQIIALWDGGAEVEIYSDQGHPSHWFDVADADADTVPEAICLAFLKAHGVDWREEE